jgi:TolB-like protein
VLRPDAETDFLAFSLADAVTSSLSGLQSLVVRSSLAATRFSSESPDLKAIASEAEVDAVLVGTVLRAGPQIRVSTQLLEAPAATVLWSHTAQAPVGDLFSLQDDLTGRIVESLSLPLTTRERRMLKQDVPSSPQAYEQFLRANEMSRETKQWQAALDLYESCTRQDPQYAPAWAGLGRMHRLVGKYIENESVERFARAETALKRALELNPDLTKAENLYAHLEVDLGHAEEAMVRLLTRARGRSADPELFAGLSHACRYCGLLQASVAAAEQAVRLDPKIPTSVVQTYFMLGDYARVADYDRETVPLMRNLGRVMLGRTGEALQSLDTIEAQLPNRLVMYTMALRHVIRGERDAGLSAIRQLLDIRDPEGRYHLVRQLIRLGEHEAGLSILDAVVDNGFFCLPAFARDPWLDGVRGTPEFAAILRRVEARHRQAVISFLTAEGDRVLGVAHPV